MELEKTGKVGRNRLALKVTSKERERVEELANSESRRERLLGEVALDWIRGETQANSAKRLGVVWQTIKAYRDAIKRDGIEAMGAGKPRTDLQTVASSLLAGDVNLDLDSIAQLCLGHLASLRADETADRSKAINDCIAMLYKCAEKKDSSGDKLGDALADAMKG